MQTGASALLAAASIATLYSLVRFFDLFRRKPTVEVEPQRIDFDASAPVEPLPVRHEILAPPAAAEPRLVVDNIVDEKAPPFAEEPPEEIAPSVKSTRRAKTPRKNGGRAKAGKSAPEADLSRAAAADIEKPVRPDVPEIVEPELREDPIHPPVAPLFEPEPFVRQQQRAMFGRKAG